MTLPNLFLFVGLPYIAFVTLLIGTYQRYRNTGFKVSSLSIAVPRGQAAVLGLGALPLRASWWCSSAT